jgi:hypothetical protein
MGVVEDLAVTAAEQTSIIATLQSAALKRTTIVKFPRLYCWPRAWGRARVAQIEGQI